tara:strand:- start:141 stop:1169 length:1029 start_codon:yes stop_codon:yes gene_type:complete
MIDFTERLKKLQGLLNSPMNQPGGLLTNIPQGAILGSAIYSQGIQGKDPFSAFLPAVTQTSQIQSQFLQMEEMKRKMKENVEARKLAEKQRNYFDSLDDNHPFKDVAEAFPSAAASGVIQMELKKIDDRYKFQKDKNKAILDYKKNIQDQENKLFTAYQGNKVVQEFDASTASVTKLLAGLEANNGAGDVAAIFTFMKTLDPGSVVREGEFAVAEDTQGAFGKWWNYYNKLKTGKRLPEKAMQEFKELGINLYQKNQMAVDNIRNNFSELANNQGLNIDNIFVDADIRPKYENRVDMAAPGASQTVSTKRVPANAILVDYQDGQYFFKIPGRRDYLITDGFK